MKEKIFKKGIKRRLFSIALALVMVFSLLPMNSMVAHAATLIDGSSIYWDLEDGTLTISGSGKMPELAQARRPWYSEKDNISRVVIAQGVESVSNYAFYNCSKLTEITIPASVTTIGENAFYNCKELSTVTLSTGLITIGNNAFYNCSKLTEITIPEGVTTIGNNAFDYCSSLTKVTIPTSVTSIGTQAFRSCSSLTEVTIPTSVTSIEQYAFDSCSKLATVIVNATEPPTIGTSAFRGTSSTLKIYVPEGKEDNYKSAWSAYADKIAMPHEHSWKYSATDNELEAYCENEGCDNYAESYENAQTNNKLVTLTLTASSPNYSGITGLSDFNTATGLEVKESDVKLYTVATEGDTTGGTEYTGAIYKGRPTEKGNYYASLTVGDATAVKAFKTTNKVWTVADGATVDFSQLNVGDIVSRVSEDNYYIITSDSSFTMFYIYNSTGECKCFFSTDDADVEGFTKYSCSAEGTTMGADYTVVADPRHTHDWQYSATDNVIEAYCTTADCPSGTSETDKVSLTLTASDANYSGSAYTGASLGDTSTWSDAGLSLPDIKYVGKGTTYPENTIAPTNVGTYTAKITVDDATAYADFAITKADRTGYTVVVSNYVYNTTPSTPELSPALSEGIATYYYNTANSNAGGTAWAGVTAATLDTGTYYMYAVIGESDNYNAFTTPAVSFTVTGATLETVTATTPTAVDYDGAQHGISAVTCATEGTTVKYGTVEGTYNLTTAPTFKDAGTHKIYYQVTKTGYTPETGSVDVVINKKSITATVTAANKDYDGTDTATVSASVNSSDLISGDSITITGLTGTFANANAGDAKTVTVNTLAATVSGTGKDNYIVSYAGTTTANINKVASTLTSAPTKKVGVFSTLDTSKALVEAGTAAPGGSLEYKVDDSSWTSAIPTVSTLTVGAHTVYYRVKSDDINHTNLENSAWKIDIEVVSGNITVNTTGATSSNLEEVVAIPENIVADKTVSIELSVDAKADTDVAHKTAMEEKVAAVLGNAAATKEYLDIKLNKAVNSVADGTIADTTKPLEIAITYSVAAGKAYSIIRDHEGTVTAFTQLTDKPTSNFVDGTFFVGSGVIYIYSRYFSDYMIGSISGHSVIFNTNGGNSISSAVVADGGTLATVPTPTKSGYNFVGWYTNSTLSAAFEKTTPITANVTLYAKWVAVPSPTPGNGGQSSSISPVGAHTHVVGDIWLYDHELSREGNKLRHKACVVCGEPMNYEVVAENNSIAAETATSVVTPNSSAVNEYVVVGGDCMVAIAAKFGMTLNELVGLNPHISNPSLIYPGNILKIKSSGTTTASNSESQAAPYEVVDYIVKSGDWMIQIAKEHGMSFEELYKINPQVKTPSLIFPGDILKVKKN